MQRVSGNVRWGFEGWFHDEKKSGSVVLDLHIHDLDFLRYMLGEPDDFEVRATTFDSGMINQVITTYEFGDVFATAEGVWDVSPIPKFQAGFRAYFENGTVYFNQAGQPGLAVYKADGTEIVPELHPEYEGQTNNGINITNLGPILYRNQIFSGMSAGWQRNHPRTASGRRKIRRTGTGRVGSCKAVSS